MLAPIILFVYNRPVHTQKVIEALASNPESKSSKLFIFSDGPRRNVDIEKVNEVRAICRKVEGFESFELECSESNSGLSFSIIRGVSKIIAKYGSAIILEDDLLVNVNFLEYMNHSLQKYQNESNVASIHAYQYPINNKNLPDTFFIKGADCWGWATWERAWNLFQEDGCLLRDQLVERKLVREFDFNHSYPYFQMLEDQIGGKNNSWAIRWYASAFLADKYTLYPKISLVKNIGLDGTGTHSGFSDYLTGNLNDFKPKQYPTEIHEDPAARKEMENFFRRGKGFNRIKSIILKCLRLFF